jgi:hypothetical protein
VSRQKIRRLTCDGQVASAFTEVLFDDATQQVIREAGVRRGDPIPCTAVFEVANLSDWAVIDQRARANGWTLRGGLQERKHYCPKHKRQETDHG